jgi:hypothetical protein
LLVPYFFYPRGVFWYQAGGTGYDSFDVYFFPGQLFEKPDERLSPPFVHFHIGVYEGDPFFVLFSTEIPDSCDR